MLGLEKEARTRRRRKSTRRRVRHDIIIGILETARHGKLKTHIMKEVKLNFRQLQYYLNQLLSKNFIRKEGNIYRTTEKGLDVIEACKICRKLMEQ
ncbi:MAG: winged helix-turn-helix domain-containing protein [Candidatus Bathyarchaeota archaeon]|nr:winged helix-turn-helix domain-containing protein [Candidatus Bathyarchaeota archaeon]